MPASSASVSAKPTSAAGFASVSSPLRLPRRLAAVSASASTAAVPKTRPMRLADDENIAGRVGEDLHGRRAVRPGAPDDEQVGLELARLVDERLGRVAGALDVQSADLAAEKALARLCEKLL